MKKLRSVAAAIVMVLALSPVYAQDVAALLVASERLQGPYRGAVVLAVPYRSGHVGLILNRPTSVRMAELFPQYEPSKAVHDPVYLGGFEALESIIALTAADRAPHSSAIPMGPGLWLLVKQVAIDQVIENAPNSARYFAGYVRWRPGELAAELEQGMFLLRVLDKTKLFLPDTSGLYEELAPKRGERRL